MSAKNLALALSATAGILAMPNGATAQTTREAPNPWLDCGIGAMIFPDANLEVAAAVSNIIWDWGTTAVISAASSPDTCAGMDNVATAMFIQYSFANLELETAKGEGEYLTALSDMVGCADASAFAGAVRSDFATMVAAPGYAQQSVSQKAEGYYTIAMAASCRA